MIIGRIVVFHFELWFPSVAFETADIYELKFSGDIKLVLIC